MFVNIPKFAALHKVYLDEAEMAEVRQNVETQPDVFTRREDKDDWIFQGGSIASLMGLTSEHEELLNAYSNELDAIAKVTLEGNNISVQTDHPSTAPNREEAVVLDGVFKQLLSEELLSKITVQWQNMSLQPENQYYLGGIPQGLRTELQAEPNKMVLASEGSDIEVPVLHSIIEDKDIDTFKLLIQHPEFEPHQTSSDGFMSMVCCLTNDDIRSEMTIDLINHPKTTLDDLLGENNGSSVEKLLKSAGMPTVVMDVFYSKVRELGGSV